MLSPNCISNPEDIFFKYSFSFRFLIKIKMSANLFERDRNANKRDLPLTVTIISTPIQQTNRFRIPQSNTKSCVSGSSKSCPNYKGMIKGTKSNIPNIIGSSNLNRLIEHK